MSGLVCECVIRQKGMLYLCVCVCGVSMCEWFGVCLCVWVCMNVCAYRGDGAWIP